VLLGMTAAHVMHTYRGRWRTLLDSVLMAPMVLPPTVLGFMLLILLGNQGPLGWLLSSMGLGIVFTWYAAVLTATVVALPLMYKTTLGAFEQIDSHLQQVARTLGASEQVVFLRITLPLALPGLIAGSSLAFARALGEFGATLMLAGNIPGRTQTLPMAIYFAVEAGDTGEASMWTGLMLVVAVGGLVFVNQWQLRYGENTSGRQPLKSPLRGHRYDKSLPQPPKTEETPATLMVSITKRLPDFTLDIAFSTADTPRGLLGVLGASGAGKSLLLRCIAGIETPDTGRIVLNGRVLFDHAKGINVPSCDRKVGLLFQNYALFPHLTVAQNIAFGLPKSLTSAQIHTIVREQLTAIELEAMAENYPRELSGGQQQRVGLARALASQPEVLLLDEPSSALDTHLRDRIEHQLMERLQSYRGITLLVTHNLQEAYRLCHQLMVIDQGTILDYGPKRLMFEHPTTERIAQLTGCKNISTAAREGTHLVNAHQWQCRLHTAVLLGPNLAQVGIQAEHVEFIERGSQQLPVNTFNCWLATSRETPYSVTLYLTLHQPPTDTQNYHIQAEIPKPRWTLLQKAPLPWAIYFNPSHLIPLTETTQAKADRKR
ncbi:MAG: molybdate ABC transporter permease subunit, partial [Cyanobacteria bacterium P01_D01_bin.56]